MNPSEVAVARSSKEATTQVAFRLPAALLKRLDKHAERLSAEHPGLTFTRVDALRTLLTRALNEVEAATPRRSPKAGR